MKAYVIFKDGINKIVELPDWSINVDKIYTSRHNGFENICAIFSHKTKKGTLVFKEADFQHPWR